MSFAASTEDKKSKKEDGGDKYGTNCYPGFGTRGKRLLVLDTFGRC
jgi:hypothetical protein